MALGGVDFSNLKIVLKSAQGGDPGTEVAIRYGVFISALIAFAVIAFVVFWIAKTRIREAPEAPAPATQVCPFCREEISGDATRCRYCTSAPTPA